MTLPPGDPRDLTARTLAYYDTHAQAFWEGTRDHDVRQNIDALLTAIEAPPPFDLLDVGCGPGRDLAAFTTLGHRATGLEGSAALAAMARAHSGCPVLEQDFIDLALPPARFDGVFANAALFHVPRPALPRVLRQLHETLRPRGVLLASNPRGHGEEDWRGGRYGVFYDLDEWRELMVDAEFVALTHYYRPTGLPREQQPWLVTVWRKPG